jgi:hypothetical protein
MVEKVVHDGKPGDLPPDFVVVNQGHHSGYKQVPKFVPGIILYNC